MDGTICRLLELIVDTNSNSAWALLSLQATKVAFLESLTASLREENSSLEHQNQHLKAQMAVSQDKVCYCPVKRFMFLDSGCTYLLIKIFSNWLI